MKAPVILTAALSFLAAGPLVAQMFPSPSSDLQPPSGDVQLNTLETDVKTAGAAMAQRKSEELAAPRGAPADIDRDYNLDPINQDLAPELQQRITIYKAKASSKKPVWERRLIVLAPDMDNGRRLPLPRVDCMSSQDKGVRVIGGHYLAVATDRGVLYSDLGRQTPGQDPCQTFAVVGTVRYGSVTAVEGLKNLDILPDALKEVGLSGPAVVAAAGNAGKILRRQSTYEIYGNKDKLLATYTTPEGGELKLFWPDDSGN